MELEALGKEADLCALVVHADEGELDLGPIGVGRIVDGLVEILDFLIGEVDFYHCLSQT